MDKVVKSNEKKVNDEFAKDRYTNHEDEHGSIGESPSSIGHFLKNSSNR